MNIPDQRIKNEFQRDKKELSKIIKISNFSNKIVYLTYDLLEMKANAIENKYKDYIDDLFPNRKLGSFTIIIDVT